MLIKYKGKEENVCIPDNVHTISGAAFKDNRFTIRVFIPNTVRHIESYAFHNCFYLQNVYFEDGGNLKTIKPFVFEDDRSLLSVIIPSSVKSIGDHAFSECCNLNEVRFMNGLEIINNFAFKGCKSLNKIDLPMSLKEVGSYAFIGCLPAKIEYPQHISDKFIQTMYYYSDVEKQQLPNGKIQCILITQSDI